MFFVELKLGQGTPFFEPQVVTAVDNRITVEIKEDPNCNPVKIIKNSHPIQLRETKVDPNDNHSGPFIKNYEDILPKQVKTKTFEESLKQIEIDCNIMSVGLESEIMRGNILAKIAIWLK